MKSTTDGDSARRSSAGLGAETWPPRAPVADLRAPAVQAIARIAYENQANASAMLEALGLSDGEERLVVLLWERDGDLQSDLEAALGLRRSTVSKMLQRMQEAGIVERRASEQDRRDARVTLTPAGRALRYRIEEVWQELERRAVGGLSPQERGELLALLRRVESRLKSAGFEEADHR